MLNLVDLQALSSLAQIQPRQTGPKRIRHSDVPTHVDELDSMLGDESGNEEAGSRIQQFSGLVHCEKAIHNVSTSMDV